MGGDVKTTIRINALKSTLEQRVHQMTFTHVEFKSVELKRSFSLPIRPKAN